MISEYYYREYYIRVPDKIWNRQILEQLLFKKSGVPNIAVNIYWNTDYVALLQNPKSYLFH